MTAEKIAIDIGKQDLGKFANALDCAPFYSLKEITEAKSTKQLKELAGFLRVKGYTKMDRHRLVCAICEKYSDTEVVVEVLRGLQLSEWMFFQKVAEKKQSVIARAKFLEYGLLQGIGLLQTFVQADKVYFVVPKEIREIYRLLKQTDFAAQQELNHALNDYALAAVHLYGLISQDEFVALWNSQNEVKVTINQMFQILIRFVYADAPYAFYDEYIVHDAFQQNEYKDVLRWADGIADKPRYTPEKKEFLRYADGDYYEHTPQIEALTTFFVKEVKLSRTRAAGLVDDIHDLCAQEVKLQVIMDMLEKKEIEFATFDKVQKFAELYMEMHNHTRIWFNKGHTPDEISKLYRPETSEPRRVVKVGRNAPCPCGSGKKYKKCCGLLS